MRGLSWAKLPAPRSSRGAHSAAAVRADSESGREPDWPEGPEGAGGPSAPNGPNGPLRGSESAK
eukprot:11647404-Alexandrium_andersonii.AAC.1